MGGASPSCEDRDKTPPPLGGQGKASPLRGDQDETSLSRHDRDDASPSPPSPSDGNGASSSLGDRDISRGPVLVLLGSTNIQGSIMGPTKYLIATYAGPQYIH